MREQIFRWIQAQKSTFTGGKSRFLHAEDSGKDAAQRAAELFGIAFRKKQDQASLTSE